MSLRSDIHTAYDELAPTPDFLADRLLNAVVDAAPRRRSGRWSPRMRPPLALVAAFVVIAIVAGVLIGGRLVHDWNGFLHPPVPANQFQRQLSDLESRAVKLRQIGPAATCQSGPIDVAHGWWGGGPVYLASNITQGNGGGTITAWGLYITFQVMTDPSIKGPILLRAENLRTGESVLFVGTYVAGAVAGTDTVEGVPQQQHTELALDGSHPPATQAAGYVLWTMQAGFRLTDADRKLIGATANLGQIVCLGFQIDGADFSELLVTGI